MALRVEDLLITQLVDLINKNKDKIELPCFATFGAPKALNGEALWLQTLGGTKKIKEYIRGRYVGEFPFAVYYRLSAVEMGGIEAKMCVPHERISDWFDEHVPSFVGFKVRNISMTMQPTVFSKLEDGTTTYKSQFNLNYEKER